MMNRVAVRKFLPETLPVNPLSSPSTRSASATPSDVLSSGRGRSPSRTTLGVRPGSVFPKPVPSARIDVPIEVPVMEVEASPEIEASPVPSSPPFVPPSEAVPPPSFPLPVVTPQFNPKAGVLNMCKAVHRGDVESLASRPMEGFGHLLLSQTAMTPVIVVAMIKRYDKMRANLEAALSQLKGATSQTELLKKQLADEESKHREEISVLNAQVEEKDRRLAM
ncbi:hypothetical protein Salat_0214300 [Sesamum alatum]|uniref:Uncharacterized protein n=1 Tax=Sesamum alatum TaxID=300844 RepID=A0AAE2CY26_9LAMI|nr:hypothetical protein Salat_0214300 [Sesamum alatum]